jgi:hypothetical protein
VGFGSEQIIYEVMCSGLFRGTGDMPGVRGSDLWLVRCRLGQMAILEPIETAWNFQKVGGNARNGSN